MTRLIRLLVFYELGHFDLLENNIRSTQRYIAKQASQYQIDQLLLKFIRKIASSTDKQERLGNLKQTRMELIKLSKDKAESRTLYFFDFISWIESKLEQKSFTEIVKQKNAERLKGL